MVWERAHVKESNKHYLYMLCTYICSHINYGLKALIFSFLKVLLWADIVTEGTLYLLQDCLTEIFKLSFTRAAALLNVWGGIHRILSIFFLFLADSTLGNFVTLSLFGIFNFAGLILITTATALVYRCHGAECGLTEKVLFITGMSLIALGNAAVIASFFPFRMALKIEWSSIGTLTLLIRVLIVWNSYRLFLHAVCLPIIVLFSFPYVKKWYIVFGVAAMCMALANVVFLSGPKPEGSPLTVAFRVFVAAGFKICQPFPKDDTQLHRMDGEEIQTFSPTIVLGFLHKAAIIVDDDKNADGEVKKRSWKVCSISEVEFTKSLIRMVPMWSTFIMSGVVSSVGDTYFIEQANNMNTNIGHWKAPIQLFQLIFKVFDHYLERAQLYVGDGGMISSIVCCTVAAAVERRRLHVVRKHHLLDLQPDDDAKVPMSAFFLIFQVAFLGCLGGFSRSARSAFHTEEAPKLIESYSGCISEGISGVGFICSALSVYAVGKISTNWFQHTLNRSRLDRYYWVLATLSSLNLIIFLLVVRWRKKYN